MAAPGKRPADGSPDVKEEPRTKKVKIEDKDLETLKNENLKLKYTLTGYESIFAPNLGGQKPTPTNVKSEWEKRIGAHTKLKKQVNDLKLHESALVMRLAAKEQELNQLQAELLDLKRSVTPAQTDVRNMMLDPTVNMLFTRMKDQLTETNQKLKLTNEDLSVATFTRESQAGRQLMNRIRLLQQENENLGKELAEESTHKLEIELQSQRELVSEYGKQLAENDDTVEQLLETLDIETEREVMNKHRKISQKTAEHGSEARAFLQLMKEEKDGPLDLPKKDASKSSFAGLMATLDQRDKDLAKKAQQQKPQVTVRTFFPPKKSTEKPPPPTMPAKLKSTERPPPPSMPQRTKKPPADKAPPPANPPNAKKRPRYRQIAWPEPGFPDDEKEEIEDDYSDFVAPPTKARKTTSPFVITERPKPVKKKIELRKKEPKTTLLSPVKAELLAPRKQKSSQSSQSSQPPAVEPQMITLISPNDTLDSYDDSSVAPMGDEDQATGQQATTFDMTGIEYDGHGEYDAEDYGEEYETTEGEYDQEYDETQYQGEGADGNVGQAAVYDEGGIYEYETEYQDQAASEGGEYQDDTGEYDEGVHYDQEYGDADTEMTNYEEEYNQDNQTSNNDEIVIIETQVEPQAQQPNSQTQEPATDPEPQKEAPQEPKVASLDPTVIEQKEEKPPPPVVTAPTPRPRLCLTLKRKVA